MIDFLYKEPYPILKDETQYRKISSDFVKGDKLGEQEVLIIDPKGLILPRESEMKR